MKLRKILTLSLLLMTFGLMAQDFQGLAVYQSKTKLDIDMSTTQMTPDQIERFKSRMKSRLERVYELNFNRQHSTFKAQEQLAAPGSGGGGSWGNSSGVSFKDISTKTFAKESEIVGKNFLIQDTLQTYNWQMTSESKMIGKYLVFKATAAVTAKENPWARWGRSRNNDKKDDSTEVSEDLPKVEFITAWYTPDIPVANGPADYWGLPGLILEVSQGNTTMLCTKVVMNPKEKAKIAAPKKGQKVTQTEYDELFETTMTEMRSRYSRGRGGNRGRG
jgi:GLPGLI family protein